MLITISFPFIALLLFKAEFLADLSVHCISSCFYGSLPQLSICSIPNVPNSHNQQSRGETEVNITVQLTRIFETAFLILEGTSPLDFKASTLVFSWPTLPATLFSPSSVSHWCQFSDLYNLWTQFLPLSPCCILEKYHSAPVNVS